MCTVDGLPLCWGEITRKVYRGHLFACLLLDRQPIFYVHGGMTFSMPRAIAGYKEGDRGHAHHKSFGRGVSADAFDELRWLSY